MNPVMQQQFLGHSGVDIPLIGGPMYPCSNPELVAAISATGALGVIQPLSLTFVHGRDFRAGIRYIRSLTDRPVGMNALIEKSSSRYRRRMEEWIGIALEEGIRFFITSLGNPAWVVEMVVPSGGIVYHDVTEAKWAEKGLKGGVQGLIAVNRDAGGHAGERGAEQLFEELAPFGVPVVGAGGVGNAGGFRQMLEIGYAAVQCGTRFIATAECSASEQYKDAIVAAARKDIVHSERITGVPVAIIRTPAVEREGMKASPLARRLLRWQQTRHWLRTWYAVRSLFRLRKASFRPADGSEVWQAGRSVEEITGVTTVADVVASFRATIPPFPKST